MVKSFQIWLSLFFNCYCMNLQDWQKSLLLKKWKPLLFGLILDCKIAKISQVALLLKLHLAQFLNSGIVHYYHFLVTFGFRKKSLDNKWCKESGIKCTNNNLMNYDSSWENGTENDRISSSIGWNDFLCFAIGQCISIVAVHV